MFWAGKWVLFGVGSLVVIVKGDGVKVSRLGPKINVDSVFKHSIITRFTILLRNLNLWD